MQIDQIKLGILTQKPIKLTQEQNYSEKLQNLPPEEIKKFLTLYELSKKQPKTTYNELYNFLKRHPTIPEALSLMTYNHILRRKVKRADETIIHNYKHNPDNLLARINYADYCLRRKRPEKIEEIFENVYDLVDLYPERNLFHVEEYRAFHTVIANYFFDLGQIELAESHLLLASNISRKHPSILQLAKKLYKIKKL